MPKLALNVTTRSTGLAIHNWLLHIFIGDVGQIIGSTDGVSCSEIKVGNSISNSSPVIFEYDELEPPMVRIQMYQDPSAQAAALWESALHQLLESSPHFEVTFSLTSQCYDSICDTINLIKRFPLQDVLVTAILSLADPEAAITVRSKGEYVGTVRQPISFEEQEQSVRTMTEQKQKQITEVMSKIQDTGVALQAAEVEKKKYEKEKEILLSQQEEMEKDIQEMCFPVITDLDMDLMLSIRDGMGKMMNIMWQAYARYYRERDRVLQQWQDFEATHPHIQEVKKLENRIAEVQNAGKQQSEVLLIAQKNNMECLRLRTLVQTQEYKIQKMEQSLQECSQKRDWESKFDVVKERAQYERLEQVYAQASMMQVPVKDVEKMSELRSKLQYEGDQLDEKRVELLSKLDSQFNMLRQKAELTKVGTEETWRAERKKQEEVWKLQENHKILEKRQIILEEELRIHALEYVKQISNLKLELTKKEVELSTLQQRIALK